MQSVGPPLKVLVAPPLLGAVVVIQITSLDIVWPSTQIVIIALCSDLLSWIRKTKRVTNKKYIHTVLCIYLMG